MALTADKLWEDEVRADGEFVASRGNVGGVFRHLTAGYVWSYPPQKNLDFYLCKYMGENHGVRGDSLYIIWSGGR